MAPRIVAVIPAAGIGSRFGADRNKPFFSLFGKPLLAWTLAVFELLPEIDAVVPVVKEQDLMAAAELADRFGLRKVKRIVPGGKERQDSVRNGLEVISGEADIVVIHDGARPMVDHAIIRQALDAVEGSDGVIAAVPVKDTIKEARSEGDILVVHSTLRRDVLFSVQTPQVFPYATIAEAHRRAFSEGLHATDDAALVEHYGGRVRIVHGSYNNFKITTPEDIAVAEAVLRMQGIGGGAATCERS